METPNSSMRRVTRSQSAASTKNISISKMIEDSEQILSKSRQGKNATNQQQQQESSKSSAALLDITNNSPIVGLARGGSLQTPLSSVAKNRSYNRKVMTPGSGEALLRGQVKTLLQKVEEESEFSKILLETRPIFPYLQGFTTSPVGPLLAPTPANTPLVLNLSEEGESEKNGLHSVTSSLNPDPELISQVVSEIFHGKEHEESVESEKSLISRSLLLDFSDKSEVSDASECSSALTQAEGDSEYHKDTDEDNSSVWSIQANASTRDEDFEEEAEEEGSVKELCSGIEKMSIMAAKFEGKHKRFVYNSNDEIVDEEEEKEVRGTDESLSSPSILKLNGLPTPKGKHMRFPLMEEDEE